MHVYECVYVVYTLEYASAPAGRGEEKNGIVLVLVQVLFTTRLLRSIYRMKLPMGHAWPAQLECVVRLQTAGQPGLTRSGTDCRKRLNEGNWRRWILSDSVQATSRFAAPGCCAW